MASVVDVCNLALSSLGQRGAISSIDPPDNTAHSEKCADFFPIARDVSMADERIVWSFATRRSEASALVSEALDYDYAYAKPAGLLRVVAVLPAGATSYQHGVEFTVEAGQILTKTPAAQIVYIVRETDTTKWTPAYTHAVVQLLSHYLAGPVTQSLKLSEQMLMRYDQAIARAATQDANQSKFRFNYTAPGVRR